METPTVLQAIQIELLYDRGEARIGLQVTSARVDELHTMTMPDIFKSITNKRVMPYILRHYFITHLKANGTDVQFIQELPGHNNLMTTMNYLHGTTKSLKTILIPLDQRKMEDNQCKNAKD